MVNHVKLRAEKLETMVLGDRRYGCYIKMIKYGSIPKGMMESSERVLPPVATKNTVCK